VAAVFSKYAKELAEVECTKEDLLKKKQYLVLSQLQNQNYGFEELRTLLGI